MKPGLSRRQFFQLTGGALVTGTLVACTGGGTTTHLYWGLTSKLFHPAYNTYVYEKTRADVSAQGWSFDRTDWTALLSETDASTEEQPEAPPCCTLHTFAAVQPPSLGSASSEQDRLTQIKKLISEEVPLLQESQRSDIGMTDRGRWIAPYHQAGGLYYHHFTFDMAKVALQNQHFIGNARQFYI